MKPIFRKLMIVGLLAVPVIPIVVSGCVSSGPGQGLESLETMSETQYQRIKLYSTLGVKIAAHRLVEEGVVSAEELNAAADVLVAVKTTPVLGGAQGLLEDLLNNSGLSGTESAALIQIVVFELQARGVFSNLGPDGGVLLTPRTSDFIDSLIEAVRQATVVTEAELKAAE